MALCRGLLFVAACMLMLALTGSSELDDELDATQLLIAQLQARLMNLRRLRDAEREAAAPPSSSAAKESVKLPPRGRAPPRPSWTHHLLERHRRDELSPRRSDRIAAMLHVPVHQQQRGMVGVSRASSQPADSPVRLLLRIFASGRTLADSEGVSVATSIEPTPAAHAVAATADACLTGVVGVNDERAGCDVLAAAHGFLPDPVVAVSDSAGRLLLYDMEVYSNGRLLSGASTRRRADVLFSAQSGTPGSAAAPAAAPSVVLKLRCVAAIPTTAAASRVAEDDRGTSLSVYSFASGPGWHGASGVAVMVGTASGAVYGFTANCTAVAQRWQAQLSAVLNITGSHNSASWSDNNDDAAAGMEMAWFDTGGAPTIAVEQRLQTTSAEDEATQSASRLYTSTRGAAACGGGCGGVTAMARQNTILAFASRANSSRAAGPVVRFLSLSTGELLHHSCEVPLPTSSTTVRGPPRAHESMSFTPVCITSLAFDSMAVTALWVGLSTGDVFVMNTRVRSSTAVGGIFFACVVSRHLPTPPPSHTSGGAACCFGGGGDSVGGEGCAQPAVSDDTLTSSLCCSSSSAAAATAVSIETTRGYAIAGSLRGGIVVYNSSAPLLAAAAPYYMEGGESSGATRSGGGRSSGGSGVDLLYSIPIGELRIGKAGHEEADGASVVNDEHTSLLPCCLSDHPSATPCLPSAHLLPYPTVLLGLSVIDKGAGVNRPPSSDSLLAVYIEGGGGSGEVVSSAIPLDSNDGDGSGKSRVGKDDGTALHAPNQLLLFTLLLPPWAGGPSSSLSAWGRIADSVLAQRFPLALAALALFVAIQLAWRRRGRGEEDEDGDPISRPAGGRGGGPSLLGTVLDAVTLVLARSPMGMAVRAVYLAKFKRGRRGAGDHAATRSGDGVGGSRVDYEAVLRRMMADAEDARSCRLHTSDRLRAASAAAGAAYSAGGRGRGAPSDSEDNDDGDDDGGGDGIDASGGYFGGRSGAYRRVGYADNDDDDGGDDSTAARASLRTAGMARLAADDDEVSDSGESE